MSDIKNYIMRGHSAGGGCTRWRGSCHEGKIASSQACTRTSHVAVIDFLFGRPVISLLDVVVTAWPSEEEVTAIEILLGREAPRGVSDVWSQELAGKPATRHTPLGQDLVLDLWSLTASTGTLCHVT